MEYMEQKMDELIQSGIERRDAMEENEEYKRRFMARIIEKIDDGDTPQETLDDIAKSEYEAIVDLNGNPPDDDADPVLDADECLSYWGDGEG